MSEATTTNYCYLFHVVDEYLKLNYDLKYKKSIHFSAKICIFNFSFGAIKNAFSAIFEIEGIDILSYYLKLPKMCFCNFKNVQKCVFVLKIFVI